MKKKSKHITRKVKERRSRKSLTIVLAVFVFAILLTAIAMTALGLFILTKTGVLVEGEISLNSVILFMSVISLAIGGLLAFFSSRIPLKPINNLINKMNRLAAGDFKARLAFGETLSSHPAFKEISTSFNTMAEELENTELLRNDFINNFSHEFKTPIVSITGFAKLLAKGNLTDEQKAEYLSAIEEESMRLSTMATNVLKLTKVENQTILSELSTYNLSEQIRSAVLLLEREWTEKNIELQLDFDDYTIEANEELLKEIWINLFDNAVKFTPRCGTIALTVEEAEEQYLVTVSNTGSEIPPEKRERIFKKFYQADESHATKGNGIGLAIVKRIVDLHGGEITVLSEKDVTSFRVLLPQKQQIL
ncbi:MAG: HAMP domain-containing histidine kinase [Clostridia bacterium]|nr:HAMP domain-containing histidine kinase [Clostridia bacterium]